MALIRKSLSALTILFFSTLIAAQTVDSIKVEQAGDKILIHYQILQSNELQVFRVTLSCFLSTGIKLEPKSITGDVGESVTGGKSEYMIVWDVLKDLEELQSAEFSVKAELVKDETPKRKEQRKNSTEKWENEKIFVIPCDGWGEGGRGKIFANTFGLRLAYMGNWGASAKILFGKDDFGLNENGGTDVFFTGIDLTKRIISKNAFQMHLMAGVEFAKLESDNDVMQYFNNYLTYEIGTTLALKRFVLSFSVSHYNPKLDTGYKLSSYYYFTTGIGLRF